MHATWRDRVKLKRAAGVDLRGRDNKNPVLHMTLSWHADDAPSPEHMRETAHDSLKALQLDHHQVLMAAHSDKEHLHVHLIINTVDPRNGRTAPMKYTKERLSRWAEAYEKDHGIRVEQRIENNRKREEIRTARAREAQAILKASAPDNTPESRIPYVPVKSNSPNRRQWFEKQEIVTRMREMRAAYELPHKQQRGVLAARHRSERDDLWQNTRAAMDHAREHVADTHRPRWRELYRAQRREHRQLDLQMTHPLERAVYVFVNRARLGNGKPLTMRQMAGLILRPGKLTRRVEAVHERERRALARAQKGEAKKLTDIIMVRHKDKAERLKSKQAAERETQWDQHRAQTSRISFAVARESLATEPQREPAGDSPRPFKRAQNASNLGAAFEAATRRDGASRADEIRREMEEWRKRNKGRDFGREM